MTVTTTPDKFQQHGVITRHKKHTSRINNCGDICWGSCTHHDHDDNMVGIKVRYDALSYIQKTLHPICTCANMLTFKNELETRTLTRHPLFVSRKIKFVIRF